MILTGNQIDLEVKNGNILISPYDPDLLNPNSYNFRLGDRLVMYDVQDVIDTQFKAPIKEILLSPDGFVLEPGKFYLGHTLEEMGSSCHVPLIGGRSSTGRLGLFVHITAPLGDIGYRGQWTLQFRATVPVKVYPGQKIGQIVFIKSYGEIDQYIGKYQGGVGPQAYNPKGLFGNKLPGSLVKE
ncbi:MAG: dCTP deaminase [bacterium]